MGLLATLPTGSIPGPLTVTFEASPRALSTFTSKGLLGICWPANSTVTWQTKTSYPDSQIHFTTFSEEIIKPFRLPECYRLFKNVSVSNIFFAYCWLTRLPCEFPSLEECRWRCTSSCLHWALVSAGQHKHTNRCQRGSQLCYTNGKSQQMEKHSTINRSKEWQRKGYDPYLLSGAVRMIQVDGDLTLPCTERVHCEHSRTQHPVPCRFNTCSERKKDYV